MEPVGVLPGRVLGVGRSPGSSIRSALDMGREGESQIECFRLQIPSEIRQNPRYRRWMGFAEILDGTLLMPIHGLDENVLLMATRAGVPVHWGMGIRFLSVDWVLAQAMSPTDRHAYETMKARMLEAYRTRPPAP